MNNIRSHPIGFVHKSRAFFCRLCLSPMACRAAVMLVALVWSSLAFGGEIHDAAEQRNLKKIKALLKASPNAVFSEDSNGRTALHIAAFKGYTDVAELLLANQASVDARGTRGGTTPLFMAVASGQIEMVKLLLANNADVNARDTSGATPLFPAVMLNRIEVAKILLAHKAEVEAANNKGETPMARALRLGHTGMAELLRQYGAHGTPTVGANEPGTRTQPRTEPLRKQLNQRQESRSAFGQATAKLRDNDFDGAIAAYTEAIKLNPRISPPYFGRGRAKAEKKDYDGAIADCDKAVELSSKLSSSVLGNISLEYSGFAWYVRGLKEADKQNYAGAIPDYDKAIGDFEAFLQGTAARNETLPNQPAGSSLARAIGYDKFWSNRAYAKMRLNDFAGALSDYNKAGELNPANASIPAALADNLVAARAVPQLIAMLAADQETFRTMGSEALVKLGALSVEPLIAVSKETNSVGRRTAFQLLGRIGDKRAIDPMIDMLSEQEVRESAAGALEQLGEPLGRVFLRTLQGDHASLEQLAATKDPRFVSLLVKSWQGKETRAQQFAALALGKMGDGHVAASLVQVIRDGPDDLRSQAEEALLRIPEPSVPPLIQSLGDMDSGLRAVAARLLGRIGDERAVIPLIACLADSKENEDVKAAAAESLGRLGDVRAVNPLIQALEGGGPLIGSNALTAVVKLGPASVDPLIRLLESNDPKLCAAAAGALGKIGDHRAVPRLISMLGNAIVRDSAAMALEQLGEPLGPIFSKTCRGDATAASELAARKDPRFVEPSLKCLSSTNNQTRLALIKCLGVMREPKAEELIITALGDDLAEVRAAAAKALGQIAATTRAVPALIGRLADPAETVRQAVAEALVMLGPLAVDPLIQIARDQSSNVRLTAINALGRIGDKRAVNPIIGILYQKPVRDQAAGVLAELGEPLGNAFVKTLQGDRVSMEQLLAGKDPRFVVQLANSLADQEPGVQKLAALALGQIGDARAVASLVQALKPADSDFRSRAVGALVKIHGPSVEPLIHLLDDEDASLRALAADALGRIGDPRAVAPLVGCLGDKAKQVSLAAAQSLHALSRPVEASTWAAPLAGGWNWPTRLRAGKYLVNEPQWHSVAYWQACARMLLGRGSLGYGVLALALGAGLASLWRRGLRESLPGLGGWLVLLNLWIALCLFVPIIHLAGGWAMLMGLALVPAWISLCVGVVTGLIRWPAAKQRAAEFVCRDHFLRFHPGPGLNWLARWSGWWLVKSRNTRGGLAGACVCPVCRRDNRFEGIKEVLAVLDDSAQHYPRESGGVLRVNWLAKKLPFDFDRVELVEATDIEVEEFVRQMRYQTDLKIQKRLPKMSCVVNAQCHFQRENTLTILRQTFGSVTKA